MLWRKDYERYFGDSFKTRKFSGGGRINWSLLYEFVYHCGSVHDPKEFCVMVIENIRKLCSYNQGRIYFLDGNNRVADQYLTGVSKKNVALYHEYYAHVENGKYEIPQYLTDRMTPGDRNTVLGVRNWQTATDDEFVCDYVRLLGLTYSLGFSFFNASGYHSVVFMLDRTTNQAFSERELEHLRLIIPLLNNYYKNFSSLDSTRKSVEKKFPESSSLTAREYEIVMLLCMGTATSVIGKKLHISVSTVYKHIAHIYDKLQVSSRQELLAYYMNK